MKNFLHGESSTVSLWRVDPCWSSELLVEYSQDHLACMILTDQHMRRCINHVQMEEIHEYLEELAQPPLFSLRMKGDSFFSHSICIHKTYCKGIVCLHNYLYNLSMHPLTIHVQDVAPRMTVTSNSSHMR